MNMRLRQASRALIVMYALAAASISGCTAEPLTEIFVCYGMDDAVAAMNPTVNARIVTLEGGELLLDSQVSLSSSSMVLSQGIVQQEAAGVQIDLVATIERGTSPPLEIDQRAQLTFAEGRVIDLFLRLESSCLSRTCAANETCVQGTCEPLEISPGCYMDHSGAAPGRICDARSTSACAEP